MSNKKQSSPIGIIISLCVAAFWFVVWPAMNDNSHFKQDARMHKALTGETLTYEEWKAGGK